MNDLQRKLADDLKRHAEAAPDRFDAAGSPLMTAAWDAAVNAKVAQRAGKADGRKFWLRESDSALLDEFAIRIRMTGRDGNRSRVLRMALHLLARVPQDEFLALVEAEYVDDDDRKLRR